jgi:hypothetical protein
MSFFHLAAPSVQITNGCPHHPARRPSKSNLHPLQHDNRITFSYANCTYAQAVWQRVAAWLDIQLPAQNAATMRRWWNLIMRADAANKDNRL